MSEAESEVSRVSFSSRWRYLLARTFRERSSLNLSDRSLSLRCSTKSEKLTFRSGCASWWARMRGLLNLASPAAGLLPGRGWLLECLRARSFLSWLSDSCGFRRCCLDSDLKQISPSLSNSTLRFSPPFCAGLPWFPLSDSSESFCSIADNWCDRESDGLRVGRGCAGWAGWVGERAGGREGCGGEDAGWKGRRSRAWASSSWSCACQGSSSMAEQLLSMSMNNVLLRTALHPPMFSTIRPMDHCWAMGSLGCRSHILTESICMALPPFQELIHCPLLSRNSAEAREELSFQGLLATPSAKQPMVPPTATLRMRQNSASKGAFLLGEYCQGLLRPLNSPLSQQLICEWFTNSTRLVSLSRQVQMTLSSQYSPQVWKSSARVPLGMVYSALVLQNWLVVQSEPQCSVEPKVSGPPPLALGQLRLPLLSMMSISPLVGQPPYSKSLGMSQMAGQSQSPLGSFARTQTLPQVKVKDWTVVSLPLMMGLRQLTPLDSLLQPFQELLVQQSPGLPPHRSQQELLRTLLAPIFSSRGTGWMQRMPSFTYVVVRLLSYTWNSLLPPPERVMSWCHFRKSSLLKSSENTSFPQADARRAVHSSQIFIRFIRIILNLQPPTQPLTLASTHPPLPRPTAKNPLAVFAKLVCLPPRYLNSQLISNMDIYESRSSSHPRAIERVVGDGVCLFLGETQPLSRSEVIFH